MPKALHQVTNIASNASIVTLPVAPVSGFLSGVGEVTGVTANGFDVINQAIDGEYAKAAGTGIFMIVSAVSNNRVDKAEAKGMINRVQKALINYDSDAVQDKIKDKVEEK